MKVVSFAEGDSWKRRRAGADGLLRFRLEGGMLGGGLTFIEPVSQQLMAVQSQLSSEA